MLVRPELWYFWTGPEISFLVCHETCACRPELSCFWIGPDISLLICPDTCLCRPELLCFWMGPEISLLSYPRALHCFWEASDGVEQRASLYHLALAETV